MCCWVMVGGRGRVVSVGRGGEAIFYVAVDT
jgi:hypothetical protein